MRKWIILIFGIFILTFPRAIFAHNVGQPPYFKINGTYANYYSVPLTSLVDFKLPQDGPTENYLVNKKIDFEIDLVAMQAPPGIEKTTKFRWDFGDGTKAEGVKNSHTYTKSGSYFLVITVEDNSTPGPQILETVLLNVLPNPSYKLPKSIINVNGMQSKDPLTDILKADFNNEIKFDGSKSLGGDSKIISYFWDLGDQQSADGATTSHAYKSDLSRSFVVLRVKTEAGFFADSFVEVENQQGAGQGDSSSSSSDVPKVEAGILFRNILIGVGVLGILIMVIRRFIRKRR